MTSEKKLTEALRKELLGRVTRQLCRRVAAVIIGAMAFRDASFEDMDTALMTPPGSVKGWLDRLIEGKEIGLRQVASMAIALDCEIKLKAVPIEPAGRAALGGRDE